MQSILFTLSNELSWVLLGRNILFIVGTEGWNLCNPDEAQVTLHGYHATRHYHSELSNDMLFLSVEAEQPCVSQQILSEMSAWCNRGKPCGVLWGVSNPFLENMWWDGEHQFRLCFTQAEPAPFNAAEAFKTVIDWIKPIMKSNGFRKNGNSFSFCDKEHALMKYLHVSKSVYNTKERCNFTISIHVRHSAEQDLPSCGTTRNILSGHHLEGWHSLHASTDLAWLRADIIEEIQFLVTNLLKVTRLEDANTNWLRRNA